MDPMTTGEQSAPLLTREDHRKAALARLKGLVDFVPLYRGSKVPSSKFSDPTQRFPKPPRTVNVGAYPTGRTVILDIDTKSDLTVEEQLSRLELVMSKRLRTTFTVATPSGGLHLYLLWPEATPLPHNGKLSRLGVGVTGDVRAAGVNGQCVLAGSVVAGKIYEVLVDAPLLQLTPSEVTGFIEGMKHPARTLPFTHRPRVQRSSPQALPEASPDASGSPLVKKALDTSLKLVHLGEVKPLDPRKLALLKARLTHRRQDKFFVKRAFIYNQLSCCENPATIMAYWRALGVARDTYSNSKLSDYFLHRDISRLTPREGHSTLCAKARPSAQQEVVSSQEALSIALAVLRRRRGFHRPRVLALELLHRDLVRGRQKPGKAYPLAWALVEDFLHPWSNLGVKRVLLAEGYLSQHYGVTPQEVRAAKGLLLRRGVMKTVVKQAPGRTAAFTVNPKYYLPVESHLLTTYRREGEQTLYIMPRTSLVVEPVTGELVDTLESLEGEWQDELPPRLREDTVVEALMAARSQA